MSGCLHPKVMLASRFFSFFKSLVNSPKFSVRFLARLAERDMRTVMGRTLAFLLDQCQVESGNLEKLSPGLIKRSLKYACTPGDDLWRIQLALELKAIRDNKTTLDGFSRDEVVEMLSYACMT